MFAPTHLRAGRRDGVLLGGSLLALAGLAWLTLWWWESSPSTPASSLIASTRATQKKLHIRHIKLQMTRNL